MGLSINKTDSRYLRITNELEAFCQKAEGRIDKVRQQVKTFNKKKELESKLAQEMKLNMELKQQLAELDNHSIELEKVCTSLETLTIVDSDKNRLDNAKHVYQLAKEVTGVRFDFGAPPSIAKGYVKNEVRRLLLPFELDAGDSDALWDVIRNTATQDWPLQRDKENNSKLNLK